MADLADLTLEHFAGHIGEPFTVGPLVDPQGEPVTVDVRLGIAEALGEASGEQRRTPFSLMFTGPMDRVLAQGIHRLDHQELGALELFLVPLQPERNEARYQAIFN